MVDYTSSKEGAKLDEAVQDVEDLTGPGTAKSLRTSGELDIVRTGVSLQDHITIANGNGEIGNVQSNGTVLQINAAQNELKLRTNGTDAIAIDGPNSIFTGYVAPRGAISTVSSNGETYVGAATTEGLRLIGKGSTFDIVLLSSAAGAQQALTVDGSSNVGIPNGNFTVSGSMDVIEGGNAMVIGADSNLNTRTDATDKLSRIGCAHFTNAEIPMAMIHANSSSGSNVLFVGGGTALMNAATEIRFFTGTGITDPTGLSQVTINSNGLTVASLAGTGTRTVVADANGILSAP